MKYRHQFIHFLCIFPSTITQNMEYLLAGFDGVFFLYIYTVAATLDIVLCVFGVRF